MIGERLNLTGQTIGKWLVGDLVIGENRKSYFKCTCLNCGTERIVKGSALTSGASTSCGCMVHAAESIEKRKETLHKNKILIDGTSAPIIKKICSGQLFRNNTSGCTGVSKSGNSWVASIKFKGVYHYLGSFPDYIVAVSVRKIAEKEYFGNILNNI